MLPLVRQALAEAGWTLAAARRHRLRCRARFVHRHPHRLRRRPGAGARRRSAGRRRVRRWRRSRRRAGAQHGAQRVLACLDARMREIYVASYLRETDGWRLAGGPTVCKPDELQLPDPGPWRGAGDGFAAYPQLAARLRLAAVDPAIVPDAQCDRRARAAAIRGGRGVARRAGAAALRPPIASR